MKADIISVTDRCRTSFNINIEPRQLLKMRLDIEELEHKSTNELNGFAERLVTLMPSLYSHSDSYGNANGFLNELKKGSGIAYVVSHIAAELQVLAGMDGEYICTSQTDVQGLYDLEIGCVHADTGTYAALAAVEIVEALVCEKLYFIKYDIDRLKCLNEQNNHIVMKRKELQKNTSSSYLKANAPASIAAYATHGPSAPFNKVLSQNL